MFLKARWFGFENSPATRFFQKKIEIIGNHWSVYNIFGFDDNFDLLNSLKVSSYPTYIKTNLKNLNILQSV